METTLLKESPDRLVFGNRNWLFFPIGLAIVALCRHLWLTDSGFLILAFCGFFAVICLVGAFQVARLSVDLNNRTYELRHGYWPKPEIKKGSIHELRELVLDRKWESSSKGGRHESWQIHVKIPKLDEPLLLSKHYGETRTVEMANRYARLMGLALLDRTGEEPVRREMVSSSVDQTDTSDRSASSSASNTEQSSEIPQDPGPPPSRSGMELVRTGSERTLLLPSAGLTFHAGGALWSALVMILGSLIFYFQIWGFENPLNLIQSDFPGIAFIALFQVIALVLVYSAMVSVSGRRRVRKQGSHFVLDFLWAGLGHHRVKLPYKNIKRIEVAPGPWKGETLMIRFDKKLATIGDQLDNDGRRWLKRYLQFLATD